jgi:fluoride exporter
MPGPRPQVVQPTDPGTALARRPVHHGLWRGQGRVLAVVALGGAIGAAGRYGAGLLWRTAAPGRFPWTTLAVNAGGCAVIGVFMVVISDVWAAHRLVRPFFGTGVLGGFTTFSTYAVDVEKLVDGDRPGLGLAYLGLTPLVALTAVWAAASATRRVVRLRAGHGSER